MKHPTLLILVIIFCNTFVNINNVNRYEVETATVTCIADVNSRNNCTKYMLALKPVGI